MTRAPRLAASGRRLLALLAGAWLLGAASSGPVGAETGPDPDAASEGTGVSVSPRVAVDIGGASVVLVVANGKLHAFVDRLEDNAPVADAQVTVARDGAAPLTLGRATAGLFVAPFQIAGRARDLLTITLDSPEGAGRRTATLVYEQPKAATEAAAASLGGNAIVIALASGLLGAAIAVLIMIGVQLQRRPAGRHIERQGAGGRG